MLIYKKNIVYSITTTPGLPSFPSPPQKKKIRPLPLEPHEFGLGLGLALASGFPKAYVVRLQERSGLFEVLELEVAAAAWFVGFFAPTKKKHRFFSMGGFPVSALDICIVSSRNLPRGCYYCRFCMILLWIF